MALVSVTSFWRSLLSLLGQHINAKAAADLHTWSLFLIGAHCCVGGVMNIIGFTTSFLYLVFSSRYCSLKSDAPLQRARYPLHLCV